MREQRKRRFPPGRPVDRLYEYLEPKRLIFVVCEGTNTEPRYLSEFFADNRGFSVVRLKIDNATGEPLTLVNRALEIQTEQRRIARRSQNSFDAKFEVWVVTDVDEHANLPQAVDKAGANSIMMAISNPCIEIWGILHYKFHDGPLHRHEAQDLLEQLMPEYEKNGSKVFNFAHMKAGYSSACTRAKRIEKNRLDEDDEGGNPSTNLYELLERILAP